MQSLHGRLRTISIPTKSAVTVSTAQPSAISTSDEYDETKLVSMLLALAGRNEKRTLFVESKI